MTPTTPSQAVEAADIRVVEKTTCFAVHQGNAVVGSFAGPECGGRYRLLAEKDIKATPAAEQGDAKGPDSVNSDSGECGGVQAVASKIYDTIQERGNTAYLWNDSIPNDEINAQERHRLGTIELIKKEITTFLASPAAVAAGVEPHPHSFSCEKTVNEEQTCDKWCGDQWRCISTMTYAQSVRQETYEHGHRDALNVVEEKLAAMARSTSPHRRVAAKDLYDGLQTIKPTTALFVASKDQGEGK